MFQLPIDSHLPQIVRELSAHRNLIIEAQPGAGKTTRVPPALLEVTTDEVWVLEPRRIAARMAARRVAEEMGEKVGGIVGYQVRFEEAVSARTRLRFVTEGVLPRRLLNDPELRRAGIIVLDEFHERHLETDLALALVRRLQETTRPDLKIVVMSATLNAQAISRYLDDCPILSVEGRLFDVSLSYAGHSPAPLEQQVAHQVERLAKNATGGDILVFLPGAQEIRRASRECEQIARRADIDILPLHGDLSPEEQDRAVGPSSRRKLILATNVAESSITIDGVTTVIDSGLARIASDSEATGLPTLQVQRVSKASATQRAGRAGRTAPGNAIRLYSIEDFHRRAEFEAPEISRRELSQVTIVMRALGLEELPWLEAPPEGAWTAACELLDRLSAASHLEPMAQWPLHPRLSRMLIEARSRSVAREACRVAAILSSRERSSHVDVLRASEASLEGSAKRVEQQLLRLVPTSKDTGSDDDLRISILTGFPDHVARRRSATDAQLANGRPLALAGDFSSEFFVALDVEDRREAAAPIVRLACAIQPEWLIDLYPDRIREVEAVRWNRAAERVDGISSMLYEQIALAENTNAVPDPVQASELLAQKAMDVGVQRFIDEDALNALLGRIEFAAQHSALPAIGQSDISAVLRELSQGCRSLRDLEQAASSGWRRALLAKLGTDGERKLNEIAPERLTLKGRQVKIHYPPGQQPWIEARLQDFFGMQETPRIGRGQVPLLVHLLAPNKRPVQVTTDLAGFWQRLYPQLRKELSRRYPRHSWPENPNSAA